MDCRAILMAVATFGASACVAHEDVPVDLPVTAEIARTYRIETYDLFRCVIGLTPELRRPARGWTMTYTDELAFIETAGLVEIQFRPVGPGETEIRVRTAGNPYPLFYPGRWLATAEQCALNPGDVQALPPLLVEPPPTSHRAPIRARM